MKSIKFTLSVVLVMVVVSVGNSVHAVPKAEALPFWDDSEPSSGLTPDHLRWQKLLDKFVITGHPSGIHRLDYAAFGDADEEELRGYLAYLQQLDPRQLSKGRQKAYWLNLYNATMVLIVVVSQPSQSIRSVDRKNLWVAERFSIAGQKLSLDNIMHGILRPLFNDERIHFALNLATLGSANINPLAYTGDNVEELIEQTARDFLKHPRAVDFSGDELILSRLFFWYESDFGSNLSELKNYLKQYQSPEFAEKIEASKRLDYQFDWSLNKP